MYASSTRRIVTGLALLSSLVVASRLAMSHEGHAEKGAAAGGSSIAKVFEQELPPGDFRKASAITVSYGPGGTTPKHRHDVAVFAYVLEGEIESQLAGGELKTYRAGETWYEAPGTVHVVSRNASRTKPAKLLVFLVGEEGKSATTFVK